MKASIALSVMFTVVIMAELTIGHVAKKAKVHIFDTDKCCFCSKPIVSTNKAVTPNVSKLDSLFTACRGRHDPNATKLLQHERDIVDGSVIFSYHRQCRSSYTSEEHIRRTDIQHSGRDSPAIGSSKDHDLTQILTAHI
jgi:hypothetical protein